MPGANWSRGPCSIGEEIEPTSNEENPITSRPLQILSERGNQRPQSSLRKIEWEWKHIARSGEIVGIINQETSKIST